MFGAGGIGSSGDGWFTNTWTDKESTDELLEFLSSNDINILDSAASYPPGNRGDTSRLLGESKADSKGFIIDTKISPTAKDDTGRYRFKPFLSREQVDESFTKDLALIGVEKVRCLYLHTDNPGESIVEVASAMDQQVKKGRCEIVGLCNFTPGRFAEYLQACEDHSLTKPSIYQCHYNALVREIEAKGHILELCREHGIKIYAYSPLAGGFLSGKFTTAKDSGVEQQDKTMAGTRWQTGGAFPVYLSQFDRPVVHEAMRKFLKTCAEQDPSIESAEVALRWLVYHSALGYGDGIIIGASKLSQISRSTDAVRKGPLPDTLREAVETLFQEAEKDSVGRGATI